ncbi:hypothetical protein LUZ63_003302 [Rhynchospora breviuscula]|uniref:Uncharacterized protein n=1 Tax=Rhynchospora breviuscula TaxID=2022672 RepID=A0A9Q0D0F4_9POAL|nr:hypothetical protein LUZ63_003302 [Rhynchospora breviuscula]
MAWWQKRILFPVKRAWLHLSSKVRPRVDANDGGILKLRGDVQTCEYQDVQVMWEILRSEMEVSNSISRQRKHSFWRLPSWPHRQSNTAQ